MSKIWRGTEIHGIAFVVFMLFFSSAMLMAARYDVKPGPGQVCQSLGEQINDNLFGATPSYTVDIGNWGGYGVLTNYIAVTDDNTSITDITMKCQGSHDDGTTLYDLQICETASGKCTTFDSTWSIDPAGTTTDRFIWRVDFEGIEDVKCTFTPTGAEDEVDLIKVTVDVCTKGS